MLKRRSISNAVNPQKITLFGLLRHLPNTMIDPLPNAVFPQDYPSWASTALNQKLLTVIHCGKKDTNEQWLALKA